MPTYAWTGKDKSGIPTFREIEAATVQESRDLLLAEGCTDLQLQEDDVSAEINRAIGDKVAFLGEEVTITARDRVQYHNKPPPTITGIVLQGLKEDKSFFIVVSLCLAFCVYRHWLVGAIICAVLLIGWPSARIFIGLPSVLFHRLFDADDWHRWNDVLRLAKQLRAVGRYQLIKIPETQLARFEAYALAGKGRLSEAVALYSRVENQPGAPTWLFKSHLSTIYHNGGDYDTALKLMREAIALKPEGTGFIDLASRLARYHADAPGARAALQHVDMDLVMDLLKPFATRLRGIILWLENDFGNARQELETAIREMEKTRHIAYRTGTIAVAKGYLCCVYARLGNREAARKCYGEAAEYLVATKETRLLQDCEDALNFVSKKSL